MAFRNHSSLETHEIFQVPKLKCIVRICRSKSCTVYTVLAIVTFHMCKLQVPHTVMHPHADSPSSFKSLEESVCIYISRKNFRFLILWAQNSFPLSQTQNIHFQILPDCQNLLMIFCTAGGVLQKGSHWFSWPLWVKPNRATPFRAIGRYIIFNLGDFIF